jgi:uncharacterized membrane protein YjgN (DUF898 family)
LEQSGRDAGSARFEFSGNAVEYFQIWIVNVILTIITLGIYSAWAKVRRNRYLYSSTRLAGASFEYLAQPVQILKGRLIAVGLFAIYLVSGHVSPVLQFAEMALFIGFLPWLVNRARAFALRNTAYRNITFDFQGRYGEAAGVYILWPILLGLSLGLLYPLYAWRRSRYAIDNSRFGTQAFSFTASRGAFFVAYLKFVALLIFVLVAGTLATVILAQALIHDEAGAGAGVAGVVLVVLAGLLALLATLTYLHVVVTNLTWSSIEIAGMATRCDLATPRMFWIAFSSMVAIMLSFGLLIPWAEIRMARYRIERMTLEHPENLDALVGAQSSRVGAAGEELSDLLGVDIAV